LIGLVVAAAFGLRWQSVAGESAVDGRKEIRVSLPEFHKAAAFASSPAVRDLTPVKPTPRTGKFALRNDRVSVPEPTNSVFSVHDADGAVARSSAIPMPAPGLTFDGLSNYDNIDAYSLLIIPPDITGDVGPNHYVQAVNALVRIFDKSGNAVTPPFRMSQLFASLGTPCSTRDDGEPIVLYDPLADRWLMSQYCNNFPPFRQMVAVSKTGDPAGAYFVYEFVMPNVKINDLAKFAVWPEAYFMSDEEFLGSDYVGIGIFAFDRTKMLAGDPSAGYVYLNRPSNTTDRRSNLIPADIDGIRPPAPSTPGIFVGYTATEYGDAQDAVKLFDFRADFANPANSAFTERPESPLAVSAIDPTSPTGRTDITQPAPGEKLDSNSDRINYRVAYRNYGGSESLVFNQTARLTQDPDPYRAGVRLYELRRTGTGPFAITEQSTIGDTTSSRWIGSAAQDHQGDLAVSYNFVTDAKVPSVFYTGRLAADPAGIFREETALVNGSGVQKAFGWRWGDYAALTVDPVDDCTFWASGEYYTLASQNFSDFTWLTRIGTFRFPECVDAPRGTVSGTVTNSVTGLPIANAQILSYPHSRRTATDGTYGPIRVLPSDFEITASAKGYRTGSFVISVANGQAVVRDFQLAPIPVIENAGIDIVAESCAVNHAPEPGETLTVNISLRNTGVAATQSLVARLLPILGVTNPSSNQNYGSLAPAGASVTRPFTFTVSPLLACGDSISLSVSLSDGTQSLGIVVIDLRTGSPRVAIKQNFDRSQQVQLPPRWTRSENHSNTIELPGDRNWRVSAARSTSGTKSAFSPDLNQTGVNEMVTPVFHVSTANARLTFQNWYDLETTFLRNRLYDGSVLEIRIGNAQWQDIIEAGGTFESGGYDGIIDGCCSNPLAGQMGWSGRSGPNQTPVFITTAVRLPATAAGQLVQLRWRIGTDVGTFREGQYIDDLEVTDGYVCGCAGQ
jgi:hypothetical protein